MSLADEWAIHQLLARYADAVNRRDGEDWRALWTDDGVWEVFGTAIAGRDAVFAAWSGAMKGFELVFHVSHGVVIEAPADPAASARDGDEIEGRVTLSEQLRTSAGEAQQMLALYHDRYRRDDGRWRFAHRKLEVLYHGAPDLSTAR